MTASHEAKQVGTETEPGESCTPLAGAIDSAAEAGGSTGGAIPEATPIPTPNDSRLLQKIDASVEEQLSLVKLGLGILRRIPDQLKQQAEESLVRLQRPILLELVLLHDNLEGAIGWARGSSELSVEDVVSRLETLRIELLEVLSRRDVRLFEKHPASLDPKLHRTMKTLPTSESSENNTVSKILRAGFFWGDKVLRPEDVEIKKYPVQEPPKGD